MKILKSISTGIVFAIIFVFPFVLLQNSSYEFINTIFYAWAGIVEWISYPLSFVLCKGQVEGECGMVIILTAPITGFIMGSLLSFMHTKFKISNLTREIKF